MDKNEDVFALAENFSRCTEILAAIGDETRQHIILEMMKSGNCNGLRVGDIAAKNNLSRPAVSHHLHIMKDSGIVGVRKEGTKNYYYFDSEMKSLKQLISTLQLAVKISETLPNKR